MLSNNFWYGFTIGIGLVFFVFIVSRLFVRARSKKDSDS